MSSPSDSDQKASRRLRKAEATSSGFDLIDPSELTGSALEEFRLGLEQQAALAENEEPWAGEDNPIASPMDGINSTEI